MKKIDWRIVVAGMGCVTAMEITALLMGYNGTILKIALVVVAGMAGYVIPSPIKLK